MQHLSIWLLPLVTYFWAVHPFHISVCEINYNSENGSLEITHKLFWDDFRSQMIAINGHDLGQAGNPEPVAVYMDQNFKVWIDNRVVKPVFLGFEVENEAIWCYQEIPGIGQFDRLDIRNTILTDLFGDQQNIVHVTYGEAIKSVKLDLQFPQGTINFSD